MKQILIAAIAATASSAALATDDLKVSGWLDFYYQYDFNKPGSGATVNGRGYDITQNTFSLANAVVRFALAPTEKRRYGFTLDASVGRNAEINAGLDNSQGAAVTTNANSPTKLFQQAFVTYAGADGTTWDFGKFNTWIGYESVYAVDNANYSISPLFNYSQPFWHTGLRVTKAISDKATVGLYAVNGWNTSEDDNGSKTLGFSYTRTLSDKLTTSFNWIGGNETAGNNGIGLPSTGLGGIIPPVPTQANVNVFDFVGVYKASEKHTLAFNFDYASVKGLETGAPSGNWHGFSVFSNHTLSDSRDFSLRYSVIHDTDGLRGLNGSLSSLTGTYSIKTADAAFLKFELRQDATNFNFFTGDNLQKHVTLTVAHVIKF